MAGSNIADENVVPITFQNGLWDADLFGAQDPPTDGFCEILENLYPDEAGALRFRPAFQAVQDLTPKNPATYPNTPAIPTGSFSTNVPAKYLVADIYDGASANKVFAVSQGYTQSGFAAISALTNISGFVEANNFIYACGSSGAVGVVRISNITYGPVAFTTSSIAGSPLLDGMIYFRGRLFGFKDSTVYFTEVVSTAAPNPETWNTSTNNFILGSEGTRPKIHQMMSFNDRIYVFTDSGIFVIVVQGSPTSWIVKPFDLSVWVSTKDCAVQYKGIMYIAAVDGVYVFNGNAPRLISQAVSYYFRVSRNWMYPKIYIASEFLILSMHTLQPDGTNKTQPRIFGMNLSNPGAWFRILPGGYTGSFTVLGSVRSIKLSTTSIYDGLIVGVFDGTYSTLTVRLFGFVWGAGQDNIGSPAWIPASVLTAWKVVGAPYKLNHHKYSYVEWAEAPSYFSYTTFIDGGTPVGGSAPSGSTPIQFKNIVKILGLDTPIRQIQTVINWSAQDGLFSRLKAIYAVMGTERSIPDESSY